MNVQQCWMGGEDAGSKLEKAKKIASINIIDEDGFLQMVNVG